MHQQHTWLDPRCFIPKSLLFFCLLDSYMMLILVAIAVAIMVAELVPAHWRTTLCRSPVQEIRWPWAYHHYMAFYYDMSLPSTSVIKPYSQQRRSLHSPWHSRVFCWVKVPGGQVRRHFPLCRKNRLLQRMQKSWLKQLSHVVPHSATQAGRH